MKTVLILWDRVVPLVSHSDLSIPRCVLVCLFRTGYLLSGTHYSVLFTMCSLFRMMVCMALLLAHGSLRYFSCSVMRRFLLGTFYSVLFVPYPFCSFGSYCLMPYLSRVCSSFGRALSTVGWCSMEEALRRTLRSSCPSRPRLRLLCR